MEMNTRLQVEHPVTEMITGLDLVEWQIRVARGEPLPLTQQALTMRGHAFEARVYAEDPSREFMPSVGKIRYLKPPQSSEHVRIDSGVTTGDTITSYYDPMIAKLIVWDETREQALSRLAEALKQYVIVGVAHNVEFLRRIARSERFRAGDVSTALIEQERAALFAPRAEPDILAWQAAAAIVWLHESEQARQADPLAPDRYSPWREVQGWRLCGTPVIQFVLQSGAIVRTARIERPGSQPVLIVDEQCAALESWRGNDDCYQLYIDGKRVSVTALETQRRWDLVIDGEQFVFQLVDPYQTVGQESADTGGSRSPMPGRVVATPVKPGDRVKQGAPLIVIEAMKTEYTIAAAADGTVSAVHFAIGDSVAEGDELVALTADPIAQM
jgi:3-methylcrotonyl-CoA carboxylase alpha subunit